MKVKLSPVTAARLMTRSAMYVDLVVVERLTPDFDFASRSRAQWAGRLETPPDYFATVDDVAAAYRASWEGSVRIHYRVLENLKSKSASRFDMSGGSDGFYRVPARLGDLKYFLRQQDLAAWSGPGSCDSIVQVREGGTYLIFRDANAHLLRTPVPISFTGEVGDVEGPAHIPVSMVGDPWVGLVRSAIAELKVLIPTE